MSTTLAKLGTEIDQALRLEADKNPEALQRYRSHLKDRADQISGMPEAELRREAMRAANERDADALWRITEAYIVTNGRKKANVSLATLDSYRLGLERLLKHWEGENLLRPSRDAGNRYISDLQIGKHGDRPLEPGTIQVRLAAARAFYRALRWAGATDAVPFADTSAPSDTTPPEDRRTAYKEEAIEELLHVADELGAVIVLLGADGGLRASEMLDLRWSDINFTGSTIRVRNGKGGKGGTVEASPDLLEALQDWKPHAPAERVFPFGTTAAARYRLRELCKLAGVQYLGLHSLRHSCGTWLASESERGIEDAKIQLRHANIGTTSIYAKMDRRTLKKAMKRRRRLLESSPS